METLLDIQAEGQTLALTLKDSPDSKILDDLKIEVDINQYFIFKNVKLCRQEASSFKNPELLLFSHYFRVFNRS